MLAGMASLEEAPYVHADDAATWRAWLAEHHATATGAWLVTWRARTGRPRLAYEDAICEALCFGWVDSTGGSFDVERGKLYFARRRPGSVWARSNRERVERLIAQGRMAPAGLAAVERARADGSWSILESAERLEVPEDLASALAAEPAAQRSFAGFPPSTQQALLSWVATAKRPGTRASRISRIVASAARGERDPR
jgi:uncharacterized protein YdeI (YjbR/CyaY-like superfamily)